MNANALIVVPVLFALSLSAAVILFAFFKSTAIVRTPRYQAGGAIAGFIIVYGLLHYSFSSISGYQVRIEESEKTIKSLIAKSHEYEQFTATRDIAGTVDPYSGQTKIVLAVTETDVPINRKFRLSAPCVDLKKGKYALYVIREGRNYPFEIFPDEDISALKISIPQ